MYSTQTHHNVHLQSAHIGEDMIHVELKENYRFEDRIKMVYWDIWRQNLNENHVFFVDGSVWSRPSFGSTSHLDFYSIKVKISFFQVFIRFCPWKKSSNLWDVSYSLLEVSCIPPHSVCLFVCLRQETMKGMVMIYKVILCCRWQMLHIAFAWVFLHSHLFNSY